MCPPLRKAIYRSSRPNQVFPNFIYLSQHLDLMIINVMTTVATAMIKMIIFLFVMMERSNYNDDHEKDDDTYPENEQRSDSFCCKGGGAEAIMSYASILPQLLPNCSHNFPSYTGFLRARFPTPIYFRPFVFSCNRISDKY